MKEVELHVCYEYTYLCPYCGNETSYTKMKPEVYSFSWTCTVCDREYKVRVGK